MNERVSVREIGERIRKLRTDQELSLDRLAYEASRIYLKSHPTAKMITPHWIMRLERGDVDVVNLEKLAAVAEALGVPYSHLVVAEGEVEDPLNMFAIRLRARGVKGAEVQRIIEDIRRQLAKNTKTP